jgi:hypothetical protein
MSCHIREETGGTISAATRPGFAPLTLLQDLLGL